MCILLVTLAGAQTHKSLTPRLLPSFFDGSTFRKPHHHTPQDAHRTVRGTKVSFADYGRLPYSWFSAVANGLRCCGCRHRTSAFLAVDLWCLNFSSLTNVAALNVVAVKEVKGHLISDLSSLVWPSLEKSTPGSGGGPAN